jgi:hypothetical protein
MILYEIRPPEKQLFFPFFVVPNYSARRLRAMLG